MFSDHLQKIDKVPYKTLMFVAAGLVFLCQLVAMVLVVAGQVEKAEIRDAQYSSARNVIADCPEIYSGAPRTRCLERMSLHLGAETAEGGEQARATWISDQRPSHTVGSVKSLFNTAFSARR